MKVAFCGPSGSGKTTLAKYIQEKFNLNYIPGSASLIMSEEDKEYLKSFWGYTFSGHKEVLMKSGNPDFAKAFQKIVAFRRKGIIMDNDNFITDRSPIDNLTYFLAQASYGSSEFEVVSFKEECQIALTQLTHVIYIKSTNPDGIEDNDSRIPNTFYQHMVDSIFENTIAKYFNHQLGGDNTKFLILDMWDLGKRKSLVDEFLSA